MIRWTIRRKLILVLTICTFVFVAALGLLISYISYEDYRKAAATQQSRLVQAVESSAAIAAFVENDEIANEVLQGLLQDDEILAVRLTGLNGFTKTAGADLKARDENSNTTVSIYELHSPADPENKVGELQLWANETLISERATSLVYTNLTFLIIVCFALSIATTIAMNLLVVSPLRWLATQLTEAGPESSKELTVDQWHRRDEIGLVTERLNRFIQLSQEALEVERALKEKLSRMNKHFNSVFSSSNVGILILDDEGKLLHHNPVLTERIIDLKEYSTSRVENEDFFQLIFKDPTVAWELVEKSRRYKGSFSADLELRASSKTPHWVHCLLTVNQTEVEQAPVIEIVLYDVTERIEETERIQQLAEEDELTGLLNRRGAQNFLDQASNDKDSNEQLILLMIDLDGFKPVNDEHGHDAGDIALKVIAHRLSSMVRSNHDAVARIGGDEFLVILNTSSNNPKQVEQLAQSIVKKVAEPIELKAGQKAMLGASLGIAFVSKYLDIEESMRAADQAMYTVKSQGKNGYAFASENTEGGE